ncbi:MAG: DUF1700 domain-containing protein [Bdellovibrionales bacterium]
MRKEEFLSNLRSELRGLDPKDIEEIISDQEEFIRDAMSAGRTEEEVIGSLGSPKSFADALKLEYKVNKINNASSTWESYREVLGSIGILIALAPLNLILLFGPVIAILGFLFSWIVTSGTIIIIGSAMLLAQFIMAFVVGFTFVQTLAILFLSIGVIALGLCGVAIFILFSQLFIKVFTVYAKWNIDLVNGGRS